MKLVRWALALIVLALVILYVGPFLAMLAAGFGEVR